MQIDANALLLLALPEDNPRAAAAVRAEADAQDTPLVTNWACVGEAFYLLAARRRRDRVPTLWAVVRNATVIAVRHPTPPEEARAQEVTAKYADLPADLADALLVAAAEVLDDVKILTLDRDFRVYRTADGRAFDVRPQEAR